MLRIIVVVLTGLIWSMCNETKTYDPSHNCYNLLDLSSAQKLDHFLEILVHFNDTFEAHCCVLEHGVVVFVNLI